MIGALQPWWRERTDRERWLLAAMAALALPILLWLLVWRPLHAARLAAEARLADSVAALGEVRALAPAIRAAEARRRDDRPLLERVGSHAGRAGLTTERLQADGDGAVALRIAAVRPALLLGWIAELQRDGIVVDRLAVTRNDDSSVAADLVLRG